MNHKMFWLAWPSLAHVMFSMQFTKGTYYVNLAALKILPCVKIFWSSATVQRADSDTTATEFCHIGVQTITAHEL